jgi:inositol phosphorylceramide synthase catalytic subunit
MEDFIKRFKIAIGFFLLYGSLVLLTVGWRSDHTIIISVVCGLILLHNYSYKTVLVLSSFLAFLIIYDTLPAFPNHTFSKVHILEPYHIELALFGVDDHGQRVVLNEWFATRTNDVLSLIAGFSYILWMPLPMMYAGYLFFKNKGLLFDFGMTFLLTCIIGMIGYYIYPAAPPWYYINHGVGTDFTIPGSEGLLSEFDRIVGMPIFNGIYAKGANVFCAIPSLHCSYPVVCMMTAWKIKNRWHITIFALWALGTWFAAVYSQHHYVIDVILGVICALIAGSIINYISTGNFYKMLRRGYLNELGAEIVHT